MSRTLSVWSTKPRSCLWRRNSRIGRRMMFYARTSKLKATRPCQHARYTLEVHDRLVGSFAPEPRRGTRFSIVPTKKLCEELISLSRSHKPLAVGRVSEKLAREVLDGGSLRLEGHRWRLECIPIRDVPDYTTRWRPDFGVRSDDLMTVARRGKRTLHFPTEVKGSIRQDGVSRSAEAKMFYQLPGTLDVQRALANDTPDDVIGGGISVVINHLHRRIVINVVPSGARLLSSIHSPRV